MKIVKKVIETLAWALIMLFVIMHAREFSHRKLIPCDQGENCCLRKMTKWYWTPLHPATMYCPVHKMYHHTMRACMMDPKMTEVENANIRAREKEIGYDVPPDPVVRKPEGRIR